MCLIVSVEAAGSERERLIQAARHASVFGLEVSVAHPQRWPWARDRGARASISSDGSCACSLLTDDADWGAETWAMQPEYLEPLARALETLAEEGPRPLFFQALWLGDAPTKEALITPRELSELARASRISTSTRYKVE